MSWNQFDELKGFVGSIKRKRSHGSHQPISRKIATSKIKKPKPCVTSKVEKVVDDVTVEDIGDFSSSDEDSKAATCQKSAVNVRRKCKKRCFQRDVHSPSINFPAKSPLFPIKDLKSVSPATLKKSSYKLIAKHKDSNESREETLGNDITWSASESSNEEIHQDSEAERCEDNEKYSCRSLKASAKVRKITSSLDCMINEFGSSSEDEQSHQTSDEVYISPLTPSQGSVDPRDPVTCRTASEWIRGVKNSQEDHSVENPEALLDSAKKKKQKWKKHGLAEQLQRLIARERSDRAFWAHRQGDSQYSQDSATSDSPGTSALVVQILSQLHQYSHLFTRCHVISSNPQEPRILDVVFTVEMSKQLGLHVGSYIRIFPPWQKLEVSSMPYPVVLCTYYCENVSTPTSSPPLDLIGIEDIAFDRPIVGYSVTGSKPSLLRSTGKGFLPTKLNFGERREQFSAKEQEYDTDDVLPVVESNVRSPYKSSKPSFMESGKSFNRNLSALTLRNAFEVQGSCSGESLSFSGLIQRVYRKMVNLPVQDHKEREVILSKSLISEASALSKKKEVRWHLLVEDSEGTFSEIRVPQEYASQPCWMLCIKSGEGETFSFTNLRVLRRTSKSRYPGIFTFISSLRQHTESPSDQLEPGGLAEQMQQKKKEVEGNPKPIQASVCYVLMVEATSNAQKSPVIAPQAHYKAPLLRRLEQASDFVQRTSCRVSVCGILLFARSIRTQVGQQNGYSKSSWSLFITDRSLLKSKQCLADKRQENNSEDYSNQSVEVDVAGNHILDNAVARLFDRRGVRLFLKDLLYPDGSTGGLTADAYSVIQEVDKKFVSSRRLTVDIAELLHLSGLPFPDLPLESREGIVYHVEGTIVDVDEDAAYCWLECDNCGDPNITEDQNVSLLYSCDNCGQKVQNPRTRVHLEVFLRCKSCPETIVKVKLQQQTVKLLMPVSYHDSQEGYDMDSILNKNVGPLTCLLVETPFFAGESKLTYKHYLEEIPENL